MPGDALSGLNDGMEHQRLELDLLFYQLNAAKYGYGHWGFGGGTGIGLSTVLVSF